MVNILVVGTPGVGKSTFAKALKTVLETADIGDSTGVDVGRYKILEISKLIQRHKLHRKRLDDERNCTVFSSSRVRRYLEPLLNDRNSNINYIVDFHSVDPLEPEWFDLCVQLRSEQTAVLFDRLAARKYKQRKIEENIQCEIFNVVGEDIAIWKSIGSHYKKEANSTGVWSLSLYNDTYDQLESNLFRVAVEILSRNRFG